MCLLAENPKAKDSNVDINGFPLSTSDTLVAASGTGDRRIAYSPLTWGEKRAQQANLNTLPPEFLVSWNIGKYDFMCIIAYMFLRTIKGLYI